jgi:hypothetical protein
VLVHTERMSLRRIRQVGFVGACVLVVGAVFAGVLPWRDPFALSATIRHARTFTAPSVGLVFLGVSLLLLAWWRLGALVHRRHPASPQQLATTMAWWCAPLMLATPLFSRDVYSYIAQGAMTVQGIDSYTFGPAILGAPLSQDVPAIWLYTPAPYGPVFLSLAADITSLTGDSTRLGMLGMRLLAVVGLGLMIWAVPRIARVYGVNPSSALWLGVLNPLVVLHLAADAHNDAIMLGLMCAGLALALERRPAAGAVLLTLAALVKAPAALGLVFLVPIWAGHLRGGARWLRAALTTGGIAAAVVVSATTVAGTGYGWVNALDTPAIAHTWTSITTDLGYWTGLLVEALGVATMDQGLFVWRAIGLLLAGAICLWLLRRTDRVAPVVGIGIGLGAVVVLGPVMHPWYLLWAIVPLAAAAENPRIRRAVVYTSIAFTICVLPGGVQPSVSAFAGAAVAAGLVFGIDRLMRTPDWRQRLASALEPARDLVREMAEGEAVTIHAETADDSRRHRGEHRVVPEVLPGVDVGDVDLDKRGVQQRAGVAEGVGVMRPCPGVQHDRRTFVRGEVEPAEQFVLGVGLTDLDLEAELLAEGHAPLNEVGVRGQPVDVSLPRAESAKVRPVEYVNLHDETSR